MEPLEVFPVHWHARDEGAQYTITAFGKTPDGGLVAVAIKFFPYFLVEVPRGSTDGDAKLLITEVCRKLGALPAYCRVIERTSLWGFTNGAKVRLAQLAFPTLHKMRSVAKQLRETGLVTQNVAFKPMTTYESSMDPLLRFFHVQDVLPAHWIRVSEHARVDKPTTRAPLEVTTTFDKVSAGARTDRPPLVIASWDIETYSASRRFSKPENEEDPIIQIATSYLRYGDAEPYRQVVFCLKDTDGVAGVEIQSFDEEADLINAWIQDIANERADLLLGYNTDQFDWRYVYGRSMVCVDDMTGESLVDLSRLGRAVDGGGAFRKRELKSAAFHDNTFITLATPGVMQLDLMQLLKRDYKLDSVSLNFVSNHFLGDSKLDLPAGEIFDKFDGTAADRAIIAEYAVKDTVLPLRLLSKLCVFENLMEMANATFTPVEYVTDRGQQIKVYSVLMKKARSMKYVCPDGVGIAADGKFAGATVLNAERGAYFDIVSGLDFMSLYPSIMRAHCLCYCTIVLDARYDNLPGVTYYEIDTDQGTFRFAQDVPSVLPAMLKDLAEFRKAAKGKMAEAKARGDSFAASVHNGAQLAFKLVMNSTYGFCAASKGMLSCVPIAASVTATGRKMIQKTKALVEEMKPGSRVVYGDTDSVMCILNLGEDKRYDLRAHFEEAAVLARDISKTFPDPVVLEFEKCYLPYLLYTKKCYAGLMFTNPESHDYIDVKGLPLVRRDNCPLVKEVSTAILNRIMFDRSPELAVEEAVACVHRVLRGGEPLEKFIISKTLRSDYKNEHQEHLTVARKIQQRTGATVPSGSRVPYVFVQDLANPDCLLADKAEDPDYVRANDLPLDLLVYIKHQLMNPINRLLELLVKDPIEAVFGSPTVKPLMDEREKEHKKAVTTVKRIRTNKKNGLRMITEFMTGITT